VSKQKSCFLQALLKQDKAKLNLFLLSIALILFLNTSNAAEFPADTLDKANQAMEQALEDTLAYELVTSLTTQVGPRLAGTEQEKTR
jgi:hypothetical protein